jgi:hypothetical protein
VRGSPLVEIWTAAAIDDIMFELRKEYHAFMATRIQSQDIDGTQLPTHTTVLDQKERDQFLSWDRTQLDIFFHQAMYYLVHADEPKVIIHDFDAGDEDLTLGINLKEPNMRRLYALWGLGNR